MENRPTAMQLAQANEYQAIALHGSELLEGVIDQLQARLATCGVAAVPYMAMVSTHIRNELDQARAALHAASQWAVVPLDLDSVGELAQVLDDQGDEMYGG